VLIGTIAQILPVRRLCIFLDGLDEISPADGPYELLRIVESLKAKFPSVKLCISSHPELVYHTALCGYPGLRVQDLANSCTRQFATDILPETYRQSHAKDNRRETVDSVLKLVDTIA
jgi:hypothetical protein